MKRIALLLQMICLLAPMPLLAQQTIRGLIINNVTQEPAHAISIKVKNSTEGTYSDDRGRFQLKVSQNLPLTLSITAIGFEAQEVIVNQADAPLNISLKPTSILGQEVVVSASRMMQNKLSSPVTIEQLTGKDIRNSAQLNYMDMLQGLRGVDVTV